MNQIRIFTRAEMKEAGEIRFAGYQRNFLTQPIFSA